MYQSVFFRVELKYLLSKEQMQGVLADFAPYMEADHYGKTTIRNLYFDTENHYLIRRSLEKPVFKEKLRLRSYLQPTEEDVVFAELKRKYNGVVYKRRLPLTLKRATDWLCEGGDCPEDSQIAREICRFTEHYGPLSAAMFLFYDRVAYRPKKDGNFRVTFDTSICARENENSLAGEACGTELLREGCVLMEIKLSGGMPLWMSEILARHKIYKTSFSKYGTAYQTLVLERLKTQKKEGEFFI